jgi:DNA-binding Lrp family transcriptional regulator
MATKAYVLIETSVGKSRDVANELRSLRGVQAADNVTGPYDVIAVVEAADLTAVGALLASRIHTLNGIVRTVTCLSVGRS